MEKPSLHPYPDRIILKNPLTVMLPQKSGEISSFRVTLSSPVQLDKRSARQSPEDVETMNIGSSCLNMPRVID